jgi:toxin FitB
MTKVSFEQFNAAVSCSSAVHVLVNVDIRDALLAAMAIQHGMTVATRNTKHFAKTGAALVNLWLDQARP